MKGRAEIHEFVQGLLTASGDDGPLADSDSLLFSGRLQSIDAVEIVVFLEEISESILRRWVSTRSRSTASMRSALSRRQLRNPIEAGEMRDQQES